MTDLSTIKRVVNAQLARFNLALVREASAPSLERFFAFLRRSELAPRTVFDVGVAYGTDWLYRAFPHAKFHLVDPTRDALPHMQKWAESLDAEIHNLALGEDDGTLEISRSEKIIHATLLDLLPQVAAPVEQKYSVPIRRFDSIFHDPIPRPALCKIDVEGAELMVLKGMGEKIQSLDALIIETSMNSLYEGGPDFDEIVKHMSEQQFSFYDIGAVVRRPYDGALHQMDAIFVPDDSPLRARRWD